VTTRTLQSDRAALLDRSPAARAVLGILQTVARCRLGGFTGPSLRLLLAGRHPASTVGHALLACRRLGLVAPTGVTARTPAGRRAQVWRWNNDPR